MKVTALFLAFALSVATALPVDDAEDSSVVAARNSALEELFLGIIEQFRETMVTGADDFPVLDPLEIDHLHLELDELGLENSFITVEDLVAKKLSTFVIDDLSITLMSILQQRYSMVVEGHIPVIEVDTDKYNMDVSLSGINIFGQGNAKINILEPRLKGTFEVQISILGGISLTVRSADCVFELGGIEPEISGVFGNNMTDDFVNAFLKHLIPEIVVLYQDEISEVINNLIVAIGTIDL